MAEHTNNNCHWMRRALQLAERGRGYVEPNPLVGAVIVRDGRLVGEGWHERYGQAHAEINALSAAGEAARGATLYVTLEPCCHHGKTPPCTDAIMRAGISRVVVAMMDPFTQVAGQGLAILQRAGLSVETGLCASAARRVNAPYLKLLATGRPYVHAKWAMSLDGKIASRTGDSRWISCEASRVIAHRLRGRMDAIVVGIGTVLADDPLLTARPPGARTAVRVVLDTMGRLPVDSQLARTALESPVWVITACQLEQERQEALQAKGCHIINLPSVHGCPSIEHMLDKLGQHRMTNILVEGGAAVLGSFLDAKAIDEVHVFLSPRLLGGTKARPAVGGLGAEQLADALSLAEWHVQQVGSDLYFHGWTQSTPRSGSFSNG